VTIFSEAQMLSQHYFGGNTMNRSQPLARNGLSI